MAATFARFVKMKAEDERCPKCGSRKVRIVQASYPKAYECKKCGHVFVKSPKALVDE
jgi:uncharacterized Zn finger protein